MIWLPNQKIGELLEAMPIKCRVESRPAIPRAPAPGERYFYKAVTTAAFTFMRGKVAYVEADDWARAKHAIKRQRAGERIIDEKEPLGWKRMVRTLRDADRSIINIYSQPTLPAGMRETGRIATVELIDTIGCNNVMLVPPTTTDQDVRGLVERLIMMTPGLQTMHDDLVRGIKCTHGMEIQRSARDRIATAHLAWMIARALNIPVKSRQALDPSQHVPEALIAPTVLKARTPEALLAPTIERAFIKIVPAYSLEKLRRGDVMYVGREEWISGNPEHVQMYSHVSEDARAALGLALGTVDTAREGRLQRDRVLLVPPKTGPLRLRRIIDHVEASDPLFTIHLQMLDRIDTDIKNAWSRTVNMVKAEEQLQMRLLHGAVTKLRTLACPGDHSNDL